MDLEITQSDKLFRQEVQSFLTESLTPELRAAGNKMTSVFSDFHASLTWQKILFRKGWAAPDWPVEFGGAGWSLTQRSIFQEECKIAGAPALMAMGLQMLGPILIHYGTEVQKTELLPRLISGEDVWCQGYSEPGAGSDLASLQMRAIPDGDNYIINGSKIWTSFAHVANKIFCLVKTDTQVKPQQGISFILVDLDTPGVSVEPIISIDGEVEQCQVFFEDVRVPAANLVGSKNQGWEVAKYLLEFERGGYSYYIALNKQLATIKAIAAEETDEFGVRYSENPVYKTKLTELEIDKLALEFVEHRIKATASGGGNPGALSSMVKVVGTELSQQLDMLALELRGSYVAPLQNQVLAPQYQGETIGAESGVAIMNAYLNNRAATIYGGTAEIQRNIIAKAVLGL